MAYDAARHEGVLFGGWLGGASYNYSNETWVWNGSAWTQKNVVGPSPRVEHAMVYDSDRQVTVLFGGATGAATESGETWEWDGTAWNLQSNTGPSPRDSVGLAYDSLRHETVLFGGYGDNSETWVWDGTTWTQKFVDGPSKRWGCAMAFDASRGETVLFGGFTYDGLIVYGDTWVWDGASWTERDVSGPSARVGHSMVYDECRGVVVLFGGENTNGGTKLGDTWTWDGSKWTPQVVSGPSPRAHHAMAYDTDRSETVLFGGSPANGTVDGETWLLDAISAHDFDLAYQFDVNANPSGPWCYKVAGSPIPCTVDGATTGYIPELRGWGCYWYYDASITQVQNSSTSSWWHDIAPCDVVVHVSSESYPGPMSISWTAPSSGTVRVDGRAWDAAFLGGRDAGWTLSMSGSRNQVLAQRASVSGLYRSDTDAAFASNSTCEGGNLIFLVDAGDVLEFATLRQTYYGHFMGVSWSIDYICAGDLNADGFVNGDDYDAFASNFESGDPHADLNHDCFVNGDDYDFFAEHFESGC